MNDDTLVENCLGSLRAISSGLTVDFVESSSPNDQAFDGKLKVEFARPTGKRRYFVETKRSHLSYPMIDGLLGKLREFTRPWVLFAPYVAPPMGKYLAERNISYVDAVGNLHLLGAGGRDLLIHVEGRVPKREASSREMRLPAHLVNFAFLARRSLVHEPIRAIAQAAGVSKTTVADQLRRLTEQGFLVKTRKGLALLREKELLDRWVSAYLDVVRPRWLVGRFHAQSSDIDQFERQLEDNLTDLTWALSGGAAAWRMTHFYRGEQIVLHLANTPSDLAARLRIIPSQAGKLTILKTPMSLAFEGTGPHLVHPLLVYSEMLASQDARTRETAEDIRRQFLNEPRELK